MRIRILLADDHMMVRQGIRALLEKEGFEVVAEAMDGREAVRLAEKLKPDVAVLDIAMPLLNGIDAAREIRRVSPRTKTTLLTVHEENQYVVEALRAGVTGYVVKTKAADDLVKAIKEVSLGAVYMSPGVSREAVRAYLDGSRAVERRPHAARARGAAAGGGRQDHQGGRRRARHQRQDRRVAPLADHGEARHPRDREPGPLRHPSRRDPAVVSIDHLCKLPLFAGLAAGVARPSGRAAPAAHGAGRNAARERAPEGRQGLPHPRRLGQGAALHRGRRRGDAGAARARQHGGGDGTGGPPRATPPTSSLARRPRCCGWSARRSRSAWSRSPGCRRT